MRIWIDALTPKQAKLAASFYHLFTSMGYEVIVTAREYDYTTSILRMEGVEFTVVGRYGGESLRGKLEAEIERMSKLIDVCEKADVLLSYPNPAACRVAYGLAKPIVLISDSPHSIYVHKLTVPLAEYLIHSRFIPSQLFREFTVPSVKVVTYYGVDELEWVKGFKPNDDILANLGLEENRYVIVRLPDRKASYYKGKGLNVRQVVEALVHKDFKVVIFPRYEEDVKLSIDLSKRIEKIIVIKHEKPIDTLTLSYYAYAVISGGATMAREAALLGTPGFTQYKLPVDYSLRSLGFPIYTFNTEEELLNMLEDVRKTDTSNLLEKLEKPSTKVIEVLKSLEERVTRKIRTV